MTTRRRIWRAALLGSTLGGAATFGATPVPAAEAPGAAQLLDPAYMAANICAPIPTRRTELYKPGYQLAAAQAGAAAAAAAAEAADRGPVLHDNLGTLSYAVATRAPEAQRYFDQGLRLAFAFNHAEARRAFRQAQAIDPTCAMCYWGEAYVLGPNINYPMMPDAVAPAFAAVAQAVALKDGASERERALIEAMAKRYAADPDADRKALEAAYADAMAAVSERYPDDDEIQVLFADALMNLQPWDYWAPDRKTPKGRAAEQVAALERVLERNPDHPGAIHLYIHTVEASTTPERAEAHADRLGALMPGAGHLVHMPAHIYYRVGRYLDSLKANIKAAKADEALFAQVEDQSIYRHGLYPHNVHFVLVSAQMAGDGANAVSAAEKLGQVVSDDMAKQVGWVEAIKTAPYFAHAQFSAPETVLALPDPGGDFPFVQGSWRYARAMAQVRAGDLQAAAEEGKLLGDLAETADLSRLEAWYVPAKEVLAIAGKVVDGQVARAGGDHARAEAPLREAAALQDGLPYMEPPFWYYPVRQTLGAALLEAGKAEDAAQAFQQALMAAPNNAYALYGLVQAQEAMGDTAGAAATQTLFEKAWAGGAELPSLAGL
jgi:tetratricopeptide (TPR) repeat protein